MEENLNWRKFNTEIIDWGTLKLNVKRGETLNPGILNRGGSTTMSNNF
jgi:hypothetical protein